MKREQESLGLVWLALFCGLLVFLYLVLFALEIRGRPVFFWIANW